MSLPDDERLAEIEATLISILAGDTSARAPMGAALDRIDAITAGINLVVEELELRLDEVDSVRQSLQGILDSMIDAVVVVDGEGVIQSVNRAAQDLLGTTEPEVVGAPLSAIVEGEMPPLPDISSRSTAHLNNADITFRAGDGKLVPTVVNASVTRGPLGGRDSIVLVARDMRAKHRLIEETARAAAHRAKADELQEAYRSLRDTQAQLIQSGKLAAVGQLAGAVAHEINNPLVSVVCFTELLRKDLDKDEPRDPSRRERWTRYVDRILNGSQRCKEVAEKLLLFARTGTGRPVAVNLGDVVADTLSLVEALLKRQDTRVELALEPDLVVSGNANQLQQVVMNLVLNAAQALGSGGTVRITSVRRDREIHLVVEDDGPGIKAEHLDRIFDPFFTTKPVGEGTGLGLSIAYGVMKDHDAGIEVKSEPGKGARFSLVFETLRDDAPRNGALRGGAPRNGAS